MKSLTWTLLLVGLLVSTEADHRSGHHREHEKPGHHEHGHGHEKDKERGHRPHDGQNDSHKKKNQVNSGTQLDEDMQHPLTASDFERGKNLKQDAFAIKDDVLYSGRHFEGDIMDSLLVNGSDGKNAIRNPGSHWPNGRVPYVLSSDYTSEERAVIARAMDEYHRRTCIKFEPYNGNEANYLRLVKGSGCASRVGMTGGQQEVSLGDGCVTVGIVEHELMHALGFVHEQSRTDRDEHIRVNYGNIRRGLENNFRKYSYQEVDALGEPYDYKSVLHYGSTAFTNGNGPTIEPKESGAQIGQRVGFSDIDLNKINKLYRCGNRGSGSESGSYNRPGRRDPYSSTRPDYNRRPGSSGYGQPEATIRPNRETYRPDRPGYGGSGYDRHSTSGYGGSGYDRYSTTSRYDRYSTSGYGSGSGYDRYSTTPRYGSGYDRYSTSGYGGSGSGYDRYSTSGYGGSGSGYDRYSTTPRYDRYSTSGYGGSGFGSGSGYGSSSTSRFPISGVIDRITSTFGGNSGNRPFGGIGNILGGSRPGSSGGSRLPGILGSILGDEKKNGTTSAGGASNDSRPGGNSGSNSGSDYGRN
ncbi:uncharacterized protein LOC141854624 [Brevipalpus obovatus]|uniref:uncharacterized protein LOC141854624 n=1 Tax=Brevipalpus obovatus TaxID=246614 RepID=UPI003D9F8FB9